MNNSHIAEKGAFISKSEAVILQAVAVMLMVWHHLFGFPERIEVPYVLVLDSVFHIETMLSYFGRICIAVFAFSSGYGLRKRVLNDPKHPGIWKNYRMVLTQLLKFFNRYWIVFFVFVPVGFLMKVYPVDWVKFIKGVLGSGEGYNAEWWYVGYYLRFLLLFPLMVVLADLARRFAPVLIHIGMIAFLLLVHFLPDSIPLHSFLIVLICFVEGMYFVDSGIFERLFKFLPDKAWVRFLIGLVLLGAVFVLRMLGVQDYFIVSVFVFAVALIAKCEPVMRWIRPVLMQVGKYSTYIWLTHTFFAYYYFQKITFLPRYSTLIFVWCMLLTILSGMLLESVLGLIHKGMKKLFGGKNQQLLNR